MLPTALPLPAFRIIGGATTPVPGHSNERGFVVTLGTEKPPLPLPEQKGQRRAPAGHGGVWQGSAQASRRQSRWGGHRTEPSSAGKLQSVSDIFQSQADKYKCSLVAWGAKPRPSKERIEFQLSANAKIINWINKAQPQRTTWKKPVPAAS